MGELTFRKSDIEDMPRVSEFRKGFFPYNSSKRCYEPEYYKWKYFDNPVQQGEMWLAEENGVIAGIYGITPMRMKVFGNLINGAETHDAFTRSDFQGRGIMTKLGTILIEDGLKNGWSVIYGVGGEQSMPVAEKRLGYKRVPVNLRPLIKPIDIKHLVKARFRIPRPLSALLSLAAYLSPVINFIFNITTKIGAFGGNKSGITVSRVATFPDDIDVFWERVMKGYDIMLARNKDYLQWRFVQNPDEYSIFLAKNNAGATLGYMVTKIVYYSGVPTGFIVDFLTLEDNPGIFKKLVLNSLEEFSQMKASIIFTSAIKGSLYDKLLLRFGFIPYGNDALICYDGELGSRVVSQSQKWHFTMGDWDSV